MFRAAAIGVVALIVFAGERKRGAGLRSAARADPGVSAPSRAEVSDAQTLAKKLVVDLERVRADTESMIAARVQAEQARQEAVAAEQAARLALAEAEQRLKESERKADKMASSICSGSVQMLGTNVLCRILKHVAGLCLVVGLLLATAPGGSNEMQRGIVVAAAWIAYACVMVGACLFA